MDPVYSPLLRIASHLCISELTVGGAGPVEQEGKADGGGTKEGSIVIGGGGSSGGSGDEGAIEVQLFSYGSTLTGGAATDGAAVPCLTIAPANAEVRARQHSWMSRLHLKLKEVRSSSFAGRTLGARMPLDHYACWD
jgi:hypothetical protein